MDDRKVRPCGSVAAAAACAAWLALGIVAWPPGVAGQDPAAAARAMIARHAGSRDVEAFLDEPAVRRELRALLGPDLAVLMNNLNVNGGVELYGGALSVSGNAPHQGTEEEGVVCVQPFGAPKVHAAVFSRGRIVVYTRETTYQYLPTCVKDWITLVSSGHVDRQTQPANVRMAGAGPPG